MEHFKRILARQALGEFPNSGQFTNSKTNNHENNGTLTTASNLVTKKANKSEEAFFANKVKFHCTLCQDRGLVIDNDEVARPCKCMKQKAIINKFKSAQLSNEMIQCTFKNFRSRYYSKEHIDSTYNISSFESACDAYNGAKQFAQELIHGHQPDGLLFSGPVGSGKTFLASAIANAVIEQGIEVLFIVVPDLLDEIKATYSENLSSNTEHSLLETARKVPLLILDDLGAHNYTDWVRNKIYSIINYRLNNQLPTIITTNLTLNELKEFLGERTTSRIIQMCQSYPIVIMEDIRIAKRKEKQRNK